MALTPCEYMQSESDSYNIVSTYSAGSSYKLVVTRKGDVIQYNVPAIKPIPVSAGTVDLLSTALPAQYQPLYDVSVKVTEPNNNVLLLVQINTSGMLRIATYNGTPTNNYNLNITLVGLAKN